MSFIEHILSVYYDGGYKIHDGSKVLNALKELPYEEVLSTYINDCFVACDGSDSIYLDETNVITFDETNKNTEYLEQIANNILNAELSLYSDTTNLKKELAMIIENKHIQKDPYIKAFKDELVAIFSKDFYCDEFFGSIPEGYTHSEIGAKYIKKVNNFIKNNKDAELWFILETILFEYTAALWYDVTNLNNELYCAIVKVNQIVYRINDKIQRQKELNSVKEAIQTIQENTQNVNDVINLFTDIDKNRLNTDNQINSINKRLDKIEQMLLQLIEKD